MSKAEDIAGFGFGCIALGTMIYFDGFQPDHAAADVLTLAVAVVFVVAVAGATTIMVRRILRK